MKLMKFRPIASTSLKMECASIAIKSSPKTEYGISIRTNLYTGGMTVENNRKKRWPRSPF